MAVLENPVAIQYISKERTDEICKIAVKRNGHMLSYLTEDDQTEEICKLAVYENWRALQFVIHQTEDICRCAVNHSREALQYVRSPEIFNLLKGE